MVLADPTGFIAEQTRHHRDETFEFNQIVASERMKLVASFNSIATKGLEGVCFAAE
jgi:hypothetical protein